MITYTKTVTNGKTTYQFWGHAKTPEVCNGFSALICTFCECLKREKTDLKYVFERRSYCYWFEDGRESHMEDTDRRREHSKITYTGTSRFEEFFDIGLDIMRCSYPESFA